MSDVVPGVLGYPVPPWRYRFRSRLRGVPAVAVTRTFALGSSSRALRFPFRVSRALPAPASRLATVGAPSMGFTSPTRYELAESTFSRQLACARHHVAGFPFPLSSVLDVSHVLDGLLLHKPVGLFHPTTTSRIRSPGGFPLAQPYELVARRCPLVVPPDPCDRV
jgi:hypothetical protein